MENLSSEQKNSPSVEPLPIRSKHDIKKEKVEEESSSERYSDKRRKYHRSYHKNDKSSYRHSHRRRRSRRRRSRSRSRSRSYSKEYHKSKKRSSERDRKPKSHAKAKEVHFDDFPTPNRAPRGIFESEELVEEEKTKNEPKPVVEQSNTIQILLTQPVTTVDLKENGPKALSDIKEPIEFPIAPQMGELNSEKEIDRRQCYFRMVEREREQWETNKTLDNFYQTSNTSNLPYKGCRFDVSMG